LAWILIVLKAIKDPTSDTNVVLFYLLYSFLFPHPIALGLCIKLSCQEWSVLALAV